MDQILTRRDLPVVLGDLPDRTCADLSVSPSARRLVGPLGAVTVEPRAMQLLVALIEAEGAVLSRDALAGRLWGDIVVGDDALSRAVAIARRSLKEAGSATLRIETVPKVGYRLAGMDEDAMGAEQPAPPAPAAEEPRLGRRGLLAGLAGAAALGAGGLLLRRTADSDVEPAIAQADLLLQQGRFGTQGEARALLEKAVAANPEHARAWGLLAVAWASIAGTSSPATLPEAAQSAEAAAARALAIDRLQGDALAARVLLVPYFGNWLMVSERLQRALEVAPENPHALLAQVRLLSAVGRLREALVAGEALLTPQPGNEQGQLLTMSALWAVKGPGAAMERFVEPDRMLDVALMPWILAQAGRQQEAEAHVRALQAMQSSPSHMLSALQATLKAVATGATADREAARDALTSISRFGGNAYYQTINGLSLLGYVDEAFAAAESWYGAAMQGGDAPEAIARRHITATRVLFLPLTEVMRADARFLPLCRRIGLVDFWINSAQRPDFLKGQLLPL